jgi:Helix-turn-helix domain
MPLTDGVSSADLTEGARSGPLEPSGRADRRRTAPDPEHVTLTEAAEWLRCSPRTLERLIADGSGPPVIRLSERRLIFRVVDLRKWLAGRTRGAAELPASRRRGRPAKRSVAEGPPS